MASLIPTLEPSGSRRLFDEIVRRAAVAELLLRVETDEEVTSTEPSDVADASGSTPISSAIPSEQPTAGNARSRGIGPTCTAIRRLTKISFFPNSLQKELNFKGTDFLQNQSKLLEVGIGQHMQ